MSVSNTSKHIIRNIICFFSIFLIVVIDQFSKNLVVQNMKLHDEIPIIDNFFSLYYVRNKGAGLGLLADARWVFMSLTTIVIIVAAALIIIDHFKSVLANISLLFIVAGGIGNMIDRVFIGEVVDFFQFKIRFFDFIFNVSDVFVTFGTILFLVYYIFIFERQKVKESVRSVE